MTTKQQTKTGTTPAIEKNTSAKRKILGIVGSALVAAASLGQAACDNTENPAPASKPAEIQKEFKYEIDGATIIIENQTNTDIKPYAAKIHSGLLLYIDNNMLIKAIKYLKDNEKEAKIIIENESDHEYKDNYRAIDEASAAISIEWLVNASENDMGVAALRALNKMRGIGQGLVLVPNSRQGFSTRKLAVTEKAIKNANRIVANSRIGNAGVTVTFLGAGQNDPCFSMIEFDTAFYLHNTFSAIPQ